MTHFEKVISYLEELSLDFKVVDAQEELIKVTDANRGISELILDCEYPIIILEQYLLQIKTPTAEVYKRLLQINRELIHGALTLDEAGTGLIFRDTLQLENLDINELEGSIEALGMALIEHADEFIALAKN